MNVKFYKVQKVYRDCIKKDKRQDQAGYTVYLMMHQVLNA